VLLAAFVFLARGDLGRVRAQPRAAIALAVGALVATAVGAVVAPSVGSESAHATIAASGDAQAETGAYYRGTLSAADGSLHLRVVDRNPRVTPLPPHDIVELTAAFTHPDGHRYTIAANRPIVDDPLGRFGTWWGVGLNVWHHGRSGIGSPLLPATESKTAVFALGTVERDGAPIAAGVPVHAMTMEGDRVELDVGDPTTAVPALPDGHLRVVWRDADVAVHEPKVAHYAFGLAILAGLFVLAAAGLRRTSRSPAAG
jgi:hypothetical protein